MRTFESVDRNSFKAATYVEYKRLVCALDNVIGAIVNAMQRAMMCIMSNENIVSAHDVVLYTRYCSAMSQHRGRAQFENFISEVAK